MINNPNLRSEEVCQRACSGKILITKDKGHIFVKYITAALVYIRAGGISPADLVLARPVFLKVKVKFHFLQKASNKQSTNVIL